MKSRVIELRGPEGTRDALTEKLREGARELIGDEKSPVRWFVIGILDE